MDKKIPDNAELAWVKLEGVGQVTYLSTRRKDDGVMDYEEEYSSFIETDGDELIWSLTISRIQENMAGLYQCEVGWFRVFDVNFANKIYVLWAP